MNIFKKLNFESLEAVYTHTHTGSLDTVKLVNRQKKNEKGITLVAFPINTLCYLR